MSMGFKNLNGKLMIEKILTAISCFFRLWQAEQAEQVMFCSGGGGVGKIYKWLWYHGNVLNSS